MSDTRTLLMSFTAETCCVSGCGVSFMMENNFIRKRREKHDDFYCPNGHAQHYTGETEAQRLTRILEAERNATESWRQRAKGYDRARAAAVGQVTRIKNRIERGVCPRCNRSFDNLRRHMKGKHGCAKEGA